MAKWAVERQRAMTVAPLFDYLKEYLSKPRIKNKADLARRMGMTRQRLYMIEKGMVPTPENFVEFACAELGITMRQLERARKSA